MLTLSGSAALQIGAVLAQPLLSSCHAKTGIEVGTEPATVTVLGADVTLA